MPNKESKQNLTQNSFNSSCNSSGVKWGVKKGQKGSKGVKKSSLTQLSVHLASWVIAPSSLHHLKNLPRSKEKSFGLTDVWESFSLNWFYCRKWELFKTCLISGVEI